MPGTKRTARFTGRVTGRRARIDETARTGRLGTRRDDERDDEPDDERDDDPGCSLAAMPCAAAESG
jgi:hypothetical protein